jgi:protein-S-isoprenylcysteine O-methyltransferase Ste14
MRRIFYLLYGVCCYLGFLGTFVDAIGFVENSRITLPGGSRLEERDLVREHGDEYREYQDKVRGLVPLPRTGTR